MEENTILCPNCRHIMQPLLYRVDDGQHTKLERKVYNYDGICIGKLVYCSKCKTVAVCDI